MVMKMEEMTPANEKISYQPAGFGIRLSAYLIDLVVILAITNFTAARSPVIDSSSLLIPGLASLGIVGSLYFLLMTGFFRQTIGKMITGIEVIGIDGRTPGWSNLFFREVIGRFIAQLGGIYLGYIWVAFHPRKQGWHDRFGDTYVVHERDVLERRSINLG